MKIFTDVIAQQLSQFTLLVTEQCACHSSWRVDFNFFPPFILDVDTTTHLSVFRQNMFVSFSIQGDP